MPRRKKKSSANSLLYLLLVAFLIVAGWWLWKRIQSHFVYYREFGIELPSNYSIHGIDVSKYQQFIDWKLVYDMQVDNVRISFVFIKATEGLGNADRHFKRNWQKARDAGLVRGAYHFFLATKSGKMQAQNFISRVKLEKGDLPPVIDVEQTYGVTTDRLQQNVKEFLETLECKYGVKPVIYTNVDFYNRYLKEKLNDYPLWVAHYLRKDHPRIERRWDFWQHSEMGRVNGVLQPVDFNVFNGDSAAFEELRIQH
jgi:lysozyme